jgi:bifunctional UDP-N-acetylglucosamine pyrophosphorylase / glucosamine-1-phosphate N-acetyltransferase
MKTSIPKPLHAVAGRPMVLHSLAAVANFKPAQTVVVIGPDMQALAQAVAPCASATQPEPKGTGHAVKCGLESVSINGDVLVLFGDTPLVTPQTLQKLIDRRAAGDSPAVVVSGMTPPSPNGYGRLLVEGGTLIGIVEEKDASEAQRAISLCNGGIMLFDGKLLPALLSQLTPNNAKGELYLTDTIALARKAGHVCAHVEIPFEDVIGVNSRAELATVEAVMQFRLRAAALAGGATLIDPDTTYLSYDTQLGQDVTIEPNVFFGPGVTVANGVTIKAFSHLEGVTIEQDAIIGPFARLRPGSQIGVGTHIGNFVELKKATTGAGAKINHLSYIGDASVGAHANIGAGTITCNYDGFGKYQTEIGEGAFIGSNTALVAPVKVGAAALVGAGSVITSDVPADALALERSPQKVATNRGMATRRKERQ